MKNLSTITRTIKEGKEPAPRIFRETGDGIAEYVIDSVKDDRAFYKIRDFTEY